MNKILLGIVGSVIVSLFLVQTPLKSQDYVSDFTLEDVEGNEVSLSKLAQGKKALVVIFTSAHCSWAVKYESRFNELFDIYNDKPVSLVAINSNDPSMSQSDAVARLRVSSPFPFPYLKDSNQQVAKGLGASKNPEVFLLVPNDGGSPDQMFSIAYRGKIDDNPLDANLVKEHYLKNAITAILSGKEVSLKETPPNGCNIKWIR